MTSICCICYQEYEGMGNNAEPYKKGRCCDKCNELVIKYRMNYVNPDFMDFEQKVKLIYDELDKKAGYYLQNFEEIEKSDNVFETIKAHCSVHAKHLEIDIKEATMQGKDKHNAFDNFKHDFMFDIVKIQACQIPIIEISSNVMDLLINTKNKVYPRNVPFDNFAVFFPKKSVPIMKTDLSIYGMVIYNKASNPYFEQEKDNELYKSEFVMSLILRNPSDLQNPFKMITLPVNREDWKINFDRIVLNHQEQYLFHKIYNKVMELYVNFLDYLNHPQCVKTIYKFSENTPARISKGKTPLNDVIKIEVSGNLLRVVNLNRQHGETLKDAVLVRGHYYTFRNQNRFKRVYSMKEEELMLKEYIARKDGFIAKWKLPFKRGSGELINKKRVLT